MKKKILFVITKSVWGGAQRYVFDVATHLPKDQYEVAVACGGSGPLAEKLKEKNVRVIPIPYLERDINIAQETLSFFSLWRIFQKEKPDAVHLNSSKAGGLGAVAAFLSKFTAGNFRMKIIFTAHGWAFNEDRPQWQKILVIFLSRLGALFQNKIICVSQYDYDAARRYHIAPKQKLAMIHNGIAADEMQFLQGDEARAALHIPKNVFVAGTIAELTNNKGLRYLLAAAAQIREPVLFYIIGEGEERKLLEAYTQSRNLADKIKLTGFIPDASKYLKAFDVFILPSLKEGLPYTLLEAASAGLPLIGTAVGGIPEIIQDGENGFLVPPKNPEALAQAIKKLAADPELRASFSEVNIKHFKSEFSFAIMLQKTVTAYQ